MKANNKKTVFRHFYKATFGGYYNADEQKRILKLIAMAGGDDETTADKLFCAVKNVDEEGIESIVDCKNYLLITNFTQNIPTEYRDAVSALSDILARSDGTEYAGKLQWCREICTGDDNAAKGFFHYVTGRLTEAISAFEKAIREGCELPLPEILAKICFENASFEKALEYSLTARWIDDGTKIDIPWLSRIEEEAAEAIGEAEAERIRARVLYGRQGSCRIGFLA